jgi:long-subunit fatty acid transport protein
MSRRVLASLIVTVIIGLPHQAGAQSTETLGTRAQGMGGAFVGVADDASAVYWNPAGLAGGAYFSFVLDGNTARSVPDAEPDGGTRNGFLLALSMPALGLSYTRLQTTAVRPNLGIPENSHVESLLTHQVGATFVHSIADGFAVGGTLKVVRGIAASAVVPGNDRDDLLDHADLLGHGSTKFDVDAGAMFAGEVGRVGVTVRNIAAPEFDTGAGEELQLERQARAGAAISLLPDWKLAADVDLTVNRGIFGDVRELSIGTEGQVTKHLTARGGFRFNTIGDRGHAPAISAGASYAVYGAVLIDAQITGGSDNAFRGWGLAGRFLF